MKDGVIDSSFAMPATKFIRFICTGTASTCAHWRKSTTGVIKDVVMLGGFQEVVTSLPTIPG
jgi:hypothetical protein